MASKAATVTKLGVIGLGVLCLVAAAVLAWVVVPDQKRLPADTDETRRLEGTAAALLNATALAGGDFANVLLTDVPVTVEQRTRVTETAGDAALVATSRVLKTGDGTEVAATETAYAVDRETMLEAADPPEGWEVADHEGITVSWPPGAEKKDYPGWVSDTQTTTTLRYARTEERAGLDTYVYESSVAAGQITNEATLAGLPTELPPAAVAGLAQVLPLPAELRAAVAQAVTRLTGNVPVTYTYEATSTYWVEPATGIIVDAETHEIRKAGLELPGGVTVPPSISVFDVSVGFTEATIEETTGDAKDARGALRTFGTILPLVLLIVGVLAIVGGVVALLMGRRRAKAPPPPPAQAHAQA